MTLLLKLAFRNLIRNRTRTLLNLTMVIGAFTSIVVFKGFSNYMLWTVEEGMTSGQSGHIQIANEEIWNGDLPKDKSQAYLRNHLQLEVKIAKLPNVLKVSGRANAPVLLSNGDKTVGAFALGFDPVVEDNIEKMMIIKQGKGFSEHPEFEVLIGAGLQDSLQLKIGQTVSVVSQALSGSMSSVDLEVRGIVNSGFVDIDNSTIYIPLIAAQKLLETDRVERLAILLKSGKTLDSTMDDVQRIIKEYPLDNSKLIAKDWKQSALLFRQVNDFYGVQNLVVELILSTLVFFGILNTVGMSVYERIGEIGTLRALGDQKKDVFSLLLGEGLFLGLIGAAIGIPTAWLVSTAFSTLGIELVMPGASIPVPIHIVPLFKDYFESSLVVICTCFISTLWPSIKAMRLSIVDALRANS
jgi:putative ABC transport system permease protein